MKQRDLQTNARARMLSESPTLAISARAGELRAQGKAVLNFSAGEPDFKPPAPVTHASGWETFDTVPVWATGDGRQACSRPREPSRA